MLFFGRRILHGEQHPLRHLGILFRLRTQSTEAKAADPLGKLRIVFGLPQIAGKEFLFIRKHGVVDEPDQPVQIHDVLLNGRSGQKQLERAPRNAIQSLCLPALRLIHAGQGICFFKYSQIPMDLKCFRFMLCGKIVGGNHQPVLIKSIWRFCRGIHFPILATCQHGIGNGIIAFQHVHPLMHQVRIRDAKEDSCLALKPPLVNDQHGLMAFSHPGFVAENDALLMGRAQSKAGGCNLKRVHLNVRGSIDGQKLLPRREAIQHPGGVIRMKRRLQQHRLSSVKNAVYELYYSKRRLALQL